MIGASAPAADFPGFLRIERILAAMGLLVIALFALAAFALAG